MEEQIIPESQRKKYTFLKVLCILTWIGSTLMLLGTISGYFFTRIGCENIDSFKEVSGPFGTYTKAEMVFNCENLLVTTYVNAACAILCIVGSIMMWKRRKMGYYLYVMGELMPIITVIILMMGTGLSFRGSLVGLLFALVWVGLYGLNFKHLEN